MTAAIDAIRCITFDLDDTLWECAPVIRKAEFTFYAWLKKHYPKIPQRFTFDSLVKHRMTHMRKYPDLMHDMTALRKQWIAEIVSSVDYHPDMVDPAFQIFWEARNDIELFDHVEDTLTALGKHFKIGALTNGNADVNFIGIGHLFDFAISSADAGASKPKPRMFEMAAEAADVPIEAILHVGDDVKNDVFGAMNAGAKAAWINPRPQSWREPRHPLFKFAHVSELLPALNIRTNTE